jgi:hypothetical protein
LETRETAVAGEGNELLARVIGVIWSDKHVTITRCGGKNTPTELIILRSFALLIDLAVPEGSTLTFQTHSK